MRIKIRHGSVKGKATSGQKKPYKGFGRNRKGSKKESNGLGCKVVVNRIKPKYSGKKGTIKKRIDDGYEPLNKNKPVRFGTKQYWQRVMWIQELATCQICGCEGNLDHPHHVRQGANKDDRYMINICVVCHTIIHSVSEYSELSKTREECEAISWDNHLMCEKKEKELL